jgi:hypothetical protein
VSLLGANLAVLLLLQCPVKEGKLSELLLLVYVLLIVDHDKHLFDHFRGGVDRVLVVTCNHHVKGLVVALHDLAVSPSTRSLLHGPLSPNRNLAPRLGLQLLLRLASGADDQPDKVVVRVLVDGDPDLFRALLPHEQPRLAPGGRIEVHETLQHVLPLGPVPLTPPLGPGVLPLPVGTVNGGRGRGPIAVTARQGVDAGRLRVEVPHLLVDLAQASLQPSHLLLLVWG